MDLETLRPYCTTDNQEQVLDAYIETGSHSAVARRFGFSRSTSRSIIKRLQTQAMAAGQPPPQTAEPLPDPYFIRRRTVQRDGDHELERYWDKIDVDKQTAFRVLMERMEANFNNLHPYEPITPVQRLSDPRHLSLLTITDFHLGMYAWEKETGEAWDINIAQEVLTNAIADMIGASPPSSVGVLNQLGDFMHWDGLLPLTPASKNVVDADTRFGKLVDLGIHLLCDAISLMLKQYAHVKVLIAEGNHDPVSSIWLRKLLAKYFELDQRVSVVDYELPYYALQHGKTFLGFHHGHKTKMPDLPGIFASEPRFRRMWGECEWTYIHTGHMHHEKRYGLVEHQGAIVQQHPTLAAKDAYATGLGLHSGRGAKVHVYHKEHGQVSEFTVRPRVS